MPTTTLHRTPFSWLNYILLGYYGYLQASLGAVVPFIRKELHLNLTQTGWHFTAFALGMVIAGLTADALSRRFGKRSLFWGGGAGMALATFVLTQAATLLISVLACFFMGLMGTFLMIMIQSLLNSFFDEHAPQALTEANIVASTFASIVPLMVGLSLWLQLGWEFALYLAILFWFITWFRNRHKPFPATIPERTADDNEQRPRLPRIFWIYLAIIFFSVSIEWSVIFWSAIFMETVHLIDADLAATLVTILFIGVIISRFVFSRLMQRYSLSKLFPLTLALLLTGLPLFCFGMNPVIVIIGLFLIGLGMGNLFPLGLSMASRIGYLTPDLTSAKVALTGGSAILIMPQVLAVLGDSLGIFKAFLIIFLMVFALIILHLITIYRPGSSVSALIKEN